MSATAAASAQVEPTQGEPGIVNEPNGRAVLVHLAVMQAAWLAAIAFGIYEWAK